MKFSIAPEYEDNEMLRTRVDEFRKDILDGVVTGDDYHNFFRSLSPYLIIEKPVLEFTISISIPNRLYVLAVFHVEFYRKTK